MIGRIVLLGAAAGTAAVGYKFYESGAEVTPENCVKFGKQTASGAAEKVGSWIADTEQVKRIEQAAQEGELERSASSFARQKGQAWNSFVLQVHRGFSKLFGNK